MASIIDGINLKTTVLQRIDPLKPETPDNVITVLDVFNMLAKGMSTKQLCRARPDIRPESVTLARAFLIAKHPELYARKVSSAPDNDYRLLVDENIPHASFPPLETASTTQPTQILSA